MQDHKERCITLIQILYEDDLAYDLYIIQKYDRRYMQLLYKPQIKMNYHIPWDQAHNLAELKKKPLLSITY